MPVTPPAPPPRLSDAQRNKLSALLQRPSPGAGAHHSVPGDAFAAQRLGKVAELENSSRVLMRRALQHMMVSGGATGIDWALNTWAKANREVFAKNPLAHPAYSSAVAADHYLNYLVGQTAQVRASQVKQQHINAQKILFDGGAGQALGAYVTCCQKVVDDFADLARCELRLSSDLCGNVGEINRYLTQRQLSELTCSPTVLQGLHKQKVAHRKLARQVEAAVFAAQQALFDLGRQQPNKDGSVWIVDLFSAEPRHIHVQRQAQYDRLCGLYENWADCLQQLRIHDIPSIQRKIEQAVAQVALWGRKLE